MDPTERATCARQPSHRLRTRAALLAIVGLSTGADVARSAALIHAYDASNEHLLSFDAESPGVLVDDVALTGMTGTESLVGIDVRPADNALYAVARDGALARLVTIDVATGAVEPVG